MENMDRDDGSRTIKFPPLFFLSPNFFFPFGGIQTLISIAFFFSSILFPFSLSSLFRLAIFCFFSFTYFFPFNVPLCGPITSAREDVRSSDWLISEDLSFNWSLDLLSSVPGAVFDCLFLWRFFLPFFVSLFVFLSFTFFLVAKYLH